MADGQFHGLVADVPGAFQRGLQFRQAEQLRPIQQRAARLGVEQQQQALQLGGLQQQQAQANILGTQQTNVRQEELAMLTRNVNTAIGLKATPDNQKAEFLRQEIQQGESFGRDMTQSKKALELVVAERFQELATGTDALIRVGEQAGISQAPAGVTLSPGQKRIVGGKVVAEVASLEKLSSLQQKVAAEGIDPNSPAGFARAKVLNDRAATDPSLKRTDQQILAKASEGQLASAGFANRVKAANENIDALILDPKFDETSIQAAFFGAVPGGNIILSDQQQQFAQAKQDFITAVLRKESGAAIGADEFDKEDKKFFPQVGDKPGVLKQKALGRKRAFENLRKQTKGVFDVQFKNPQIFENGGDLTPAEQTELAELERQFGGQ